MAGISNIVGAYNINPKRISSKLSFEVGQVFSAKIVATGELNKELILRLLDGWQFPAKLQKPLDFVPEGLVKLEVEGFSDGKLLIKLVNPSKDQDDLDKNSIEDLLFQSKINLDKKDYDILKNMIKHNMPLTKDNVSKVKTIFDFREKLLNDDGEEDNFIPKYLKSKNIDPDSTKGNEMKETLKGFFKSLKNISEDEILTMLENNIELSEDNIKSFIKVSKEATTIYKELNNLSKQLKLDSKSEATDLNNLISNIKQSPSYKEGINKVLNELKQRFEGGNLSAKELKLFDGLKKLVQENINVDENLNNNDIIAKLMENEKKDSFESINPKNIETEAYIKEDKSDAKIGDSKTEHSERNNLVIDKSKAEDGEKNNLKIDKNKVEDGEKDNLITDKSKAEDGKKNNLKIDRSKIEDVDENVVIKDIEDKGVPKSNNNNNINLTKKEIEALVKEQLSDKTQEMKNIIKEVIDKMDKTKPEIYNKVMQDLKDNINDFKVFNSISNQYYYLDVPINLNKEDYTCKLLIKDDRKSGKKIDSKNVSMVVSVNTSGIGVVDAYIKVKEQNMSVNIKCDEDWIKLLLIGKNKIMNELNELGYNTFFNIEKREIEANLINCRDFFDDSSLNGINVKV